jgi:hypothetical protein
LCFHGVATEEVLKYRGSGSGFLCMGLFSIF